MTIYRYDADSRYEAGDGVLYAGSIWTATKTGTVAVPGDGSPDWRLCGRAAAYPHYRPKVPVAEKHEAEVQKRERRQP